MSFEGVAAGGGVHGSTAVLPEAEPSAGGPASRHVVSVAARDAGPATHALPRRTHPALLRPVLYAGVERTVIALESTIAIGLVATVGPRLVTLAAAAVIVGLVHPVMTWVTSQDSLATAIYVRSLGWRDYYAAHGGLRARGRVRPTLPRL